MRMAWWLPNLELRAPRRALDELRGKRPIAETERERAPLLAPTRPGSPEKPLGLQELGSDQLLTSSDKLDL